VNADTDDTDEDTSITNDECTGGDKEKAASVNICNSSDSSNDVESMIVMAVFLISTDDVLDIIALVQRLAQPTLKSMLLCALCYCTVAKRFGVDR
jgi:hypothetical protein